MPSKLSALVQATAAALTDEFYGTIGGLGRRVPLSVMRSGMGIYVATVAADHAISTIAGTEVTLTPTPTLPAGTYMFQFSLIVQSATATVSPLYGVNFTGTSSLRHMMLRYADAGGLATGTGTADDTSTNAGEMISGQVIPTFSTTGTNMGHAGGVGAINSNVLVIIDGLFVCSTSGDLELWHGSETASSTIVKAGSSLFVIKTG